MSNTVSLEINPSDPNITIVSVVLTDPTNSYGVRRSDTHAVIIAAGTVVTYASGVASFESALLDTSISYDVAWKITFSNGVTVYTDYATTTLEAYISPRSLRSARRKLAERLGGIEYYTTTELGQDNTSLISQDLINPNLPSKYYDGDWVYGCNGMIKGSQRMILDNQYNSADGSIVLSRKFGDAIVPVGLDFEILTKLPALTEHKFTGLHYCINQALTTLWTIDRVPLPNPSNTELYDDIPSWIRGPQDIIDIYRPYGIGLASESVGMSYKYIYNSENPRLEGPALSDVTGYEIAAYRKLNTWIKKNGVWQETALGLLDDEDEHLGDPELVTEVALYYAYLALAQNPLVGNQEKVIYLSEAGKQAVIANHIKNHTLPKDEDVTGANPQTGPRAVWGMKGLVW